MRGIVFHCVSVRRLVKGKEKDKQIWQRETNIYWLACWGIVFSALLRYNPCMRSHRCQYTFSHERKLYIKSLELLDEL